MNTIKSAHSPSRFRRVMTGIAAFFTALVIFYVVMLIGSEIGGEDFIALGTSLWVTVLIAISAAAAGSFVTVRSFRKNGRCKRALSLCGRFMLTLVIWCVVLVVLVLSMESKIFNMGTVTLCLFLPGATTAYLAYRKSGLSGDWLLISLVGVHAIIMMASIAFQWWKPDMHSLRGTIYSGVFVLLVMSIGFIKRVVQRKSSLAMTTYYLVVLVGILGLNLATQLSWANFIGGF
jgi:hypothetical protein